MSNEPSPSVIRDLFDEAPRTIPPRTEREWDELFFLLGSTFSPHQPINERDLFVGRVDLVAKVIDTTHQAGKHAVLYGDRGVGKSSLANSMRSTLENMDRNTICVKRSCTVDHDFGLIWNHMFDDFQIDGRPVNEIIGRHPNPYDVYKVVRDLHPGKRVVFIVDEFDRVTDGHTKQLMSDLIKYFSDNDDRTTVIVVGVANSIVDLFGNHGSLPRAMQQIYMPRMNADELRQIVTSRLPTVGMAIDENTLKQVVSLSQGFPGFMHLISLQAARKAIMRRSVHIEEFDLEQALKVVVDEADETVTRAYLRAVQSSRLDAQYREVLLGCALADADERNRFKAKDVGDALSRIGIDIKMTSFGRNLEQFCSPARGPTLIREGSPKNYRYSFDYPLLKPFVIIKGLSDGLIKPRQLA